MYSKKFSRVTSAHKPALRANLQASVLFSRCSFFKVLLAGSWRFLAPRSRDSLVIISRLGQTVKQFWQEFCLSFTVYFFHNLSTGLVKLFKRAPGFFNIFVWKRFFPSFYSMPRFSCFIQAFLKKDCFFFQNVLSY